MNTDSKISTESLITLLEANFLEPKNENTTSAKENVAISPLIDFAQSCLKKDSFLGLFNMAPQMLMRKNAKMLDFLINFKIATTFLGYILAIYFFSLFVNGWMGGNFRIFPQDNFVILSFFIFYPIFAIFFIYFIIKKFIL